MNKLILLILSISPILNVSSDEGFGRLRAGSIKRYSIFFIPFGLRKIYIFTFRQGDARLLKVLRLCDIVSWPDQSLVNSKVDSYARHIHWVSSEDLRLHIDFLKNKTDIFINTKSYLSQKISVYGAILTGVSALAAYFLLWLEAFESWVFSFWWVISSVALYFAVIYFINCLIFIYEFLRNRSVFRSTFSDLKASTSLKTFAKLAYYDWYNVQNETTFLSSIVKNAEICLWITVFMFMILGLLIKHSKDDAISKSNAANIGAWYIDEIQIQPTKLDGFISSETSQMPTASIDELSTENGRENYRIIDDKDEYEGYKKIIYALSTLNRSATGRNAKASKSSAPRKPERRILTRNFRKGRVRPTTERRVPYERCSDSLSNGRNRQRH